MCSILFLSGVEVCNAEFFDANCASDEAIIVTSARYGRMKLGHCVRRDFGYLGCGNDALQAFDDQCSGRTSCRVIISNDLWQSGDESCPEVVTGHVDIEYTCKKRM